MPSTRRILAALAIVGAVAVGAGQLAVSTVCACAPPKPEAKAWPIVSGTPQVGQSLSTGDGTWVTSGNLAGHTNTAYAYRWQACSPSCSNIGGATSASYVLQAAESGKTVRSVVTATNDGGSTEQASAQTSSVSGLQTNDCFASPGACGFPDPANAYKTAGSTTDCASLSSSGPVTASTPGQTISDLNITGLLTINASGVHVTNVCVNNGNGTNGSSVVLLNSGGDNAVFTHDTIRGTNATTLSAERAITNNSGTVATVQNSYVYWCGECLWNSPFTVTDSYVASNGLPYAGGYSGSVGQGAADHVEDFYFSDGTITADHDVLLNPLSQNSVLIGDTSYGGGGPCQNHATAINSLLGGGGYVLYDCANASGIGSATSDIENDRFARCTGTPETSQSSGGFTCGSTDLAGADTHGYWPRGGYFNIGGPDYCPPTAGQIWTGNVWDNDGATLACRTAMPVNTVTPTISAPTLAVGDTVSVASTGTWTGVGLTGTYTYQWEDCNASGAACQDIVGATSSSYVIAVAVGDTLRVAITRAGQYGVSAPAVSAQTGAVVSGGGGGGDISNCYLATAYATVANIQNAVANAPDGSSVCVSAGTYGSLSLTRSGTHTSNVVLEPVIGSNPTSGGKVTFGGVTISGNRITVRDVYMSAGVTFSDGLDNVLDHDDITNSPGSYGVYIYCPSTSCVGTILNGNRIHGMQNSGGNDGDVLRFDYWGQTTVTNNEITGNYDRTGATGHMDWMQSYAPTKASPGPLDFEHNYLHDNNVEALYQEEGGTGAGLTFKDNLMIRNGQSFCPGGLSPACANVVAGNLNINQATTPILFENSLMEQTNGEAIQNQTSGVHATVDHNIIDALNAPSFPGVAVSNNNYFTGANEWAWTLGTGDSTALAFPGGFTFKCGGSCGNGTPAGDDYELSSNPNGIGIDWSPAAQQYGPVNPVG